MSRTGATFAPGETARKGAMGLRWPAQRHRVLSGCKDDLDAGWVSSRRKRRGCCGENMKL